MTNTGGRSRRDHGKQWTEEHARRLLATCARSGLSVRAFATREGLRPKRLYWWMTRLGLETVADANIAPRERRGRTAPPAPRLLPVVVKTSTAKASIVIRRDGSTTMEVESTAAVSPAWIAAVMIELERAACS